MFVLEGKADFGRVIGKEGSRRDGQCGGDSGATQSILGLSEGLNSTLNDRGIIDKF